MPSVVLGGLLALTLAGCGLFGSSKPKPTPLTPIVERVGVRQDWQTSIGKAGNFTFLPASGGPVVLAAALDGTVVRLDNGKEVWRTSAGQKLSAGTASDGRLVVVGTYKGEVLTFDFETGKPVWNTNVKGELVAPPAITEGLVIVRTSDNRVIALDAADGKQRWNYQRSNPPLAVRSVAPPLPFGPFVLVGMPGGKIYALSLQNGAPAWEGTVSVPRGATELDRVSDVVTVPAVQGPLMCAVAFQGRAACFDMQGGSQIWSKEVSSVAGITMDDRRVFIPDEQGVVHAFDRSTGASVWRQDKLKYRNVSAPVALPMGLVVGDGEGFLHVLDRDTGEFISRMNVGGGGVMSILPALGPNTVLLQTRGGSLMAVTLQ
ncbi:outer membrane protein assembly factor BamB [Fluviibacter phosphoraccumulans]|jgi:outer membrane protein assembly factor BamB|uniref:outer membrane protein assembly factor BamB n=1 Tax=Fluviibacter phosphoraccumulans TaxID=1751046 RepID=UPI00138983F5|nr:outer membrane protein assembly factor BamB [Fluviibacter phosphoraccumulans]